MNYQDNDTLNAAQQNKNQSQADKSKNKDAMTAKLLASVAAGMVAGAGATYAAQHISADEEAQTDEELQNAEPQTQESAETVAQDPAKPTVEERIDALEEKERIREQQEQARQQHEAERQRQEQQRQRNEESRQQKEEQKPEEKEEEKPEDNNVLKDHDVKIESVEERTLEDGTTVHIYSGTMDGHEAAFMADNNGRVVAAIVDVNDDGSVDENEVFDMRESHVSTQYLASCQVPAHDNEVNVIAVQHDVDMQGETVDLAVVEMNDQRVMLIDANQNGEVDLAIADANNNGSIDEGEIQDVTDAHISMPTEDDITGNMTASVDDGQTDYSNDADVTVYDV